MAIGNLVAPRLQAATKNVEAYNDDIGADIEDFNTNDAENEARQLRAALFVKNLLTAAYSKVLSTAEQNVGKLLA